MNVSVWWEVYVLKRGVTVRTRTLTSFINTPTPVASHHVGLCCFWQSCKMRKGLQSRVHETCLQVLALSESKKESCVGLQSFWMTLWMAILTSWHFCNLWKKTLTQPRLRLQSISANRRERSSVWHLHWLSEVCSKERTASAMASGLSGAKFRSNHIYISTRLYQNFEFWHSLIFLSILALQCSAVKNRVGRCDCMPTELYSRAIVSLHRQN